MYVPRLTSEGMRGSRYWYSTLNTFYPAYGLPNCTCYAYGRWLEIANGDTTKLNGLFSVSYGGRNGGNWYRSSPSLQAGTLNPQPGDIACWGWSDYRKNGWGHVAVIEEVYPDYCVCSASYYGGTYFNTERLPLSTGYRSNWMINRGYILHGFLRMGGSSGGVVPSINMPTDWFDTIDQWPTEEQMINNSIMAYAKLSSLGWTLEAICGAIGNFKVESGVNPGMREIGNHNNGGLVGWTPLTKWSTQAAIDGVPWNDGDAQCEWIDSGKYWANGVLYTNFWTSGNTGGITYQQYKEMHDDPEQMAWYFMAGYEKPLNWDVPGGGMIAQRKEWAKFIYEYLIANLPLMVNEKGSKKPFSVLDYPTSAYDIIIF